MWPEIVQKLLKIDLKVKNTYFEGNSGCTFDFLAFLGTKTSTGSTLLRIRSAYTGLWHIFQFVLKNYCAIFKAGHGQISGIDLFIGSAFGVLL